MVDLAASIIVWAVLYYFIFEMKIVRDKIGSGTHIQFGEALKETLRIRLIVLLALFFIMGTVFITELIFVIKLEFSFDLALVDFIARVLKILLDSYLLVLFFDLMSYFIKKKRQQLSQDDESKIMA